MASLGPPLSHFFGRLCTKSDGVGGPRGTLPDNFHSPTLRRLFMPDAVAVPEAQPLSEVARVVDTFVAPSKTFTDIIRNRSWWLPFILACVAICGSAYAIDRTVGFVAVAQHQTEKNARASEQLAQLTPEQRAARYQTAGKVTRIISYASPLLILLFVAIEALVLWGSFNFGLGAKTT